MSVAAGRKSIFITGAASGMGRETALLFAEQGWFVGAYDVNRDGLDSLGDQIDVDDAHDIVPRLFVEQARRSNSSIVE